MKKMIRSSKKHWEVLLGEILIVLGAVIIGEFFLKNLGITIASLVIALPALLIGLLMRSRVNRKYKSMI